MKFFLSILFVALFSILSAQNDSLIIDKNTILIGEIKEMENGVLTLKTKYSDSDFKIEWLKVTKIISSRKYRLILIDGTRLYGTIKSDTTDITIIIEDVKIGTIKTSPSSIVYLKHVGSHNIFDRINLSLDVGYSYSKVNKLHQLNSEIKGDYYSNVWGINGYINTVQNIKTGTDPTKRTNARTGLKLFFKKDYFGSVDGDFFSNNEQNLALRSNYSISVGKYFARTNHIYFNTSAGIAYSIESFSDTLAAKKSIEGKVALELNMFNVGDITFYTNIIFFPSITERYRYRTTANFSAKYKFPRDFYIKLALDYNYDTKPAGKIEPDDYVFSSGIGWEL